ncbi:hypothetical protein [Halarchaeum salinum]|uniref:Ig-like domain repeat protein n=1 Tax=Halarchaeum salinum TaxID=489912 RepID=A0AAV3S561_9EURY
MRRTLVVAFAIAASLLLVSAPVGSAAQGSAELVVGSEHDTSTELSSGSLTNLSVSGSGSDASLVLSGGYAFRDGFDSEAADAGIPTDWEATTGDSTAWSVSSSVSYDGSQSLSMDTSGATLYRIQPTEQPYASAQTHNVSVSINQSSGNAVALSLWESGTEFARIGMYKGDLMYLNGGTWTTLDASIDAGEWVKITVSDFNGDTDTMDVSWTSPSGASGTQQDISGMNSFSTGYTSTRLQGYNSVGHWDSFEIGGGYPARASYVSTHNITNGEQARFNITSLSNVSVEAIVQTPDGTVLNSTTISTIGSHTVSIPSYGGDQLETKLNVDVTGSNPSFALDAESILFTDQAPTISNATPTGNLQTRSPTLSLNVDDPTFGTAQGDSLTVKWFLDGEQVGTSTTSSAGTVTHQVDSRFGGGNHTWHAEVTDDYGVTTTSTTQSISIPAKLSIRPINEPMELVNNSSVTVTGRFYSGDIVFEKSTSNGKIDLTGLPFDRTYTLVLSADGYYRRTVIVDSLFEQDSVYLLNDSKDSYYTEFVLNDLTGKFSGGDVRTKLFLERAINTSDGLEWVTVAGDYFGAEGRFEVDLQQEKRYRIRIVGEDNTSRVLGAYTATRSGSVALAVGEVSWEVDEPETRRVSASWVNLTDGNEAPNGVVHFQYVDPAENTSRLQVVIHEDGNASNELANTTFDAGYGTLSYNQTVSGANQTTTDWEVSWTAYNGSGEMANGSVLADGQRYTVDNPIGPKWTPVVVTCLFLFTGMLFGGRLSSIGSLAVTGVAAVMWWLGFYTASGGVVVFAGLVGLAMAVGGSRR